MSEIASRHCQSHTIGQFYLEIYDSDCNGYVNYRRGSDKRNWNQVDLRHYAHCPDCGCKITQEIIDRQEAE